MPSLTLLSIAAVTALFVAAAAFVGPIAASSGGTDISMDAYAATIKAISGSVAIAGSACLMRATGRTLLRSAGNATFKATYIAGSALFGLGAAEAASALKPLNIGYALAACCAISIVSGSMWVRFYGRAA